MTAPDLSEETKSTVTATIPILQEHGVAITSRMYERLFENHAELIPLFAGAPTDQAARLANAVVAYAENINQVEVLIPTVTSIAQKHASAAVQAEHYAIVGAELLGAMSDVLGPLDEVVVSAWEEAYGFLAAVFVQIEADLASAA